MPVAITTFAEAITAGIQIVTDFGLMPFILAGAVISVGMTLFRKARSAAR